MTNKKTTLRMKYQRNIFVGMVLGIFVMFMLYGYFVNATVQHVAERQSIENERRAVQSQVVDLERQYISLSNAITPEYAHEAGFVRADRQTFAERRYFVYNSANRF
jgi:uncharacterized membrane protein YjgN (DUF898 family)